MADISRYEFVLVCLIAGALVAGLAIACANTTIVGITVSNGWTFFGLDDQNY